MPLDPEVAQQLAREAASGLPPRSQRSLEQTRAFYRAAASLSGPAPEMASVEDRMLDLPGRRLPLRVYRPLADASLPLVMYLHGGRFISGDFITHDPVCRQLAAASGCVVIAVDYRLAPEHPFPAAVEDAWAAAHWVQQNGQEIGGSGRWAIAGDSAGGNLAAAAALLLRDRGQALPQALALIYPMLDATCSLPSHLSCGSGYGAGSEDMKTGYRMYLPEGTDRKDHYVSPLFANDLTRLPSTLVLTAEYDSLRDEAEAFAQRLDRAGVPLRQKRYDGAIHGFFQMGGVLNLGRQAMQDVAGFLREILQCAK